MIQIGEQLKIHHIKIHHAPNHLKPHKQYIDSDKYKRKKDDKSFKKFDRNSYKVHEDKDKSDRASKFDRLMHQKRLINDGFNKKIILKISMNSENLKSMLM